MVKAGRKRRFKCGKNGEGLEVGKMEGLRLRKRRMAKVGKKGEGLRVGKGRRVKGGKKGEWLRVGKKWEG